MQTKTKSSILTKIAGYDNIGVVIALAVVLVLGLIFAPGMYNFRVIMQLLKTNMLYGIVAVGVMFVLVSGGIDLSTGAIMSLSCNVIGYIQSFDPRAQRIPTVALILLSMAIGMVCGLFNGFLVGKMRIHPMLATLGTQYIFLAVSYHINYINLMSTQLYKSVRGFASARFLGIYRGVWVLVIVYIIVGFILAKTKAGRKIYAIGSNEASAYIAGINPGRVRMVAYTLCGICCGFAGFMFVSNFSYAYFDVSSDYAMKAICIAVLGGVSPTGGRGRIDGMAISILVISFINYFTTMIPSLGLYADAFYGLLVVVALCLNVITVRTRRHRELVKKEATLYD